jgi:hypothetical protein
MIFQYRVGFAVVCVGACEVLLGVAVDVDGVLLRPAVTGQQQRQEDAAVEQ